MKQASRLVSYGVILLSAAIVMIVVVWGGSILLDLIPNEFWNNFEVSRLVFPLLAFLAPAVAALAVSYIGLRIFRRHSSSAPLSRDILLVVACLSPFVICSAFMGYMLYAAATFPSPEPYPGATAKEVWSEIGHGQYDVVTYEYTVDRSLEELKRYYSTEMQRYCVPGWEFAPTHFECQEFAQCYIAECEIPRLFVKDAQFFSLYLRSNSETQTNVLYFVKDQTF
jgi:hypothetical protein